MRSLIFTMLLAGLFAKPSQAQILEIKDTTILHFLWGLGSLDEKCKAFTECMDKGEYFRRIFLVTEMDPNAGEETETAFIWVYVFKGEYGEYPFDSCWLYRVGRYRYPVEVRCLDNMEIEITYDYPPNRKIASVRVP